MNIPICETCAKKDGWELFSIWSLSSPCVFCGEATDSYGPPPHDLVYMGKPTYTLSRRELIEALRIAADSLRAVMERNLDDIEIDHNS